jgi:hypothetical protein
MEDHTRLLKPEAAAYPFAHVAVDYPGGAAPSPVPQMHMWRDPAGRVLSRPAGPIPPGVPWLTPEPQCCDTPDGVVYTIWQAAADFNRVAHEVGNPSRRTAGGMFCARGCACCGGRCNYASSVSDLKAAYERKFAIPPTPPSSLALCCYPEFIPLQILAEHRGRFGYDIPPPPEMQA